jgi:dolichol kinase
MSLVEEFKRKGIHVASSAVPLSYAIYGTRLTAIAILGFASAVMLFVESFRHKDNWGGRTFRRFFGAMLRDSERSPSELAPRLRPRWVGATPYCLASFLCVLIFPKFAAVLALLYLAAGDTAASLVGKLWGRTKIGNKSLEGSIAFVAACSIVALAANRLAPHEYPLLAAIVGAIAAALAELFLTKIDDNFSIPLSAAAVITGVAWLGAAG